MKTTKIYNNEKEVYSGNCHVNTVIFRGRIYDELKKVGQDGIKFSLQLSNGKRQGTAVKSRSEICKNQKFDSTRLYSDTENSGEWNKPTFAESTAFGETAKRILKEHKAKDEFCSLQNITQDSRMASIIRVLLFAKLSRDKKYSAEPAQAIREQNFTEISRNLPAKRKINDERVKKKKVFEANSEAYLLAKFLERCIAENNPKFPQNERQRQRWAKDFDLMLRIDRIDADDIAAAIEWSQDDNFWRSNILSGKKLREKYQQLAMKMNSRK